MSETFGLLLLIGSILLARCGVVMFRLHRSGMAVTVTPASTDTEIIAAVRLAEGRDG